MAAPIFDFKIGICVKNWVYGVTNDFCNGPLIGPYRYPYALEILRISVGSDFVSQKSRNGLSESGLSIAAARGEFAGDGRVAAA